ncbi:putative monocarboxylate transporter mch1 [Monosporozyma unispora]|nr:putative monocarboxylate transporter mch1 [Kazachstania unispora]
MPLSTLEHYLSYYLRLLLPQVLSPRASHKLAYIFSLFSAVTSGFIGLISLYAFPWQLKLNYTSTQVNTISSIANLGTYLTPPILGIIADTHGPITLSCLAIAGFIPSYSYLAYLFNNPEIAELESSYTATICCFCIIGISTSALYFSALLTCTTLYPERKLLSISLPTTCIGISSLIGSQVLKLDWFWYFDSVHNETYLNLYKVFKGLSWIYVIIGISAWIATGTVSLIQFNEEVEKQSNENLSTDRIDCNNENLAGEEHDETTALLRPSKSSVSISSAMLATQESRKEMNEIRLPKKSVFHDPILYLFGFTMLLSLGPLEMFITDMGSLSNILLGNRSHLYANLSSSLISMFAMSSTCTRILTGLLSDYLILRGKSLKLILLPLLSLALFSQILIVSYSETWLLNNELNESNILILGLLFGCVYGGLFTIYPTIVLTVWGQASFGTAYGSLMVAPAVGATISCLQYAHIYDSQCIKNAISSCIVSVYHLGTFQYTVAMLITLLILRSWYRRGIKV